MKHRIVSLLLAVLLIVSLLPGAASAVSAGKVRVIVENTAMREESYQGHQVPWKDLQFDMEVTYKSGMTADGALRAAVKDYLLGFISVEDYLTYDDGTLTGVGGLLDWGTGAWLVAVNDWITTLSEKVQAGDTVRILYTVSRGKDVGADPASTDKGLRALTFDCGSLYPSFSKDVTSYTLYVPASYSAVTASEVLRSLSSAARNFWSSAAKAAWSTGSSEGFSAATRPISLLYAPCALSRFSHENSRLRR